MSIWAILKSLKKNSEAKKSFIVHSHVKKSSDKEYKLALNVWDKLENITLKDYLFLFLKCIVFLEILAWKIMGYV